jgi:small subunit ribosomal protein S15
MGLPQPVKQQIINEYQKHETDTGSADLQVAILTERVKQLSQHLENNPKDYACRRGLLKVIGQRKRLLSYIVKEDRTRYQALIARLGIRG